MNKRCCHCKQEKPLEEFTKDRHTKDGLKKTCKSCLGEAYRVYSKAHPEKARARETKWRVSHREFSRERAKKHYYEHKDEERLRTKEYRKTPYGRFLVIMTDQRLQAKKYGTSISLSFKDVEMLLDFQHRRCAKCGKPFDAVNRFTLDHILPASRGGDLTLDNVQLLCRGCNSSKSRNFVQYRNTLTEEVRKI